MFAPSPATRRQLRKRSADPFLRITSLALALFAVSPARSAELTNAAAVRALTVEEAKQRHRVSVRGVVTFYDTGISSRFMQDESAGIYLHGTATPPNLAPGTLIEVSGVSGPGEYAPIVIPERVKVIGKAPLPEARPVSYERLATGREDSQFVEISGIVRSIQYRQAARHYQLEIATGGGRVPVFCRELPVGRTEDLLDSTVRVRGVASSQFNRQRQLFSVRLMVPGPEHLVVDRPAPVNPFATTAKPIGSLLQFSPDEPATSRTKISGEVIYFEPGQKAVLQDGTQGVEVQTRSTEPLRLGDCVEAVG